MRATHGMQANPAPPPADDTETQSELEWVVVGDEGDFGRIIVHNDDVTPYDFVILILRQVFGLAPNQAERVTLRAHVTGLAYVMTLPIEEAKHRVGRAHGLARQAGFPLAFTIELEQRQ
ncbi:MAG: ATP-dependent Clp protease adaptor ClpS [Anaerolineales bacterium]|nr:ATP-dependent Clp protease adaptor ClpS [Anaerolineales bacterium]